MPQYDDIASIYDSFRQEIGLETISSYLNQLGWHAEVLDLGCGTGRPIAAALAPRVGSYLGIDVSASMIERFKNAVPAAGWMVGNIASMNLGDRHFELCFSWGAICHLPPAEQISALRIAGAHTKPGGMILFTGGSDQGECPGTVGPHVVQHYSLGAPAYDALLAQLGFASTFQGEVEDFAWLFAYRKVL